MPSVLVSSDALLTALAIGLAVCCVPLLVMALRSSFDQLSARTSLGLVMLLLVSVLANNAVVYALAVIFVATLVTDLDFVQNIAAIFWNREWAIRKATREEIELKALRRSVEIGSGLSGAATAVAARRVQEHHSKELTPSTESSPEDTWKELLTESELAQGAFAELPKLGLFSDIRNEIAIEDPAGNRWVIDALGVGKWDYIIEFDASVGRNTLSRSVGQLHGALMAYLNARTRPRTQGVGARGILIGREQMHIPAPMRFVGYLWFDGETKTFGNVESIQAWIDEERGGAAAPQPLVVFEE